MTAKEGFEGNEVRRKAFTPKTCGLSKQKGVLKYFINENSSLAQNPLQKLQGTIRHFCARLHHLPLRKCHGLLIRRYSNTISLTR